MEIWYTFKIKNEKSIEMNKFFQFNELVEIGKIFSDCEAYLIALE